ncbi:hypothetical protein M422DRAFT_260966 [Sphaerobolus stellatus SS14]|uniref:Uncharacterized protein n=1 Tax=Sphaerobolus stellatus (strain SS14) TaxID=990650 RepID=A0A0C9U1E9_SPHS4|nr:hypothetical protein M422DRAFT_260966 [Sphaerobolus stellatus SS14]
MTTTANETAVDVANPPHSPESTPKATVAKCTAEAALPITTPSRLRTAKQVNDDNVVHHITPESPTHKRATTLDSQANLYMPPTSIGQPKPGLQHLCFTKVPDLPQALPPLGTANSHMGTQPSTQEHPDPQDPTDDNHDMSTNRSNTPPLPPSALFPMHTVDEDNFNDSPSGPDLMYPLDVPISYVHGIENDRVEHIVTAETKACWAKLWTLGNSIMLWVAAYRGKVDKARTHVLLAQKIAMILGCNAMPDAVKLCAELRLRYVGDVRIGLGFSFDAAPLLQVTS